LSVLFFITRDSGSVKLYWSWSRGPGVGGVGGRPPGLRRPRRRAFSARVILSAGPTALTYTLSLTVAGWVHTWWDLDAFAGPTLTVRIEYEQASREVAAGLLVDEVSVGAALVGSYAVYLPIVYR
jgi:hypothetical protein